MIIDIETFSLDEAAQFIEEPTAPANYKDPAKIEAFIADAKAKAIDRCALDPDLCRVVAIGWQAHEASDVWIAQSVEHERNVLRDFWQLAAPFYIGFNLLSFDLPVLIRRSQYLGLDVPPMAYNLDKYRSPHIDLMLRLSFNKTITAHSLDFYCRRFGVPITDSTSGKDIDALVRAGEWDAVALHCRADVLKTAAVAERLGYLAAAVEPATVF